MNLRFALLAFLVASAFGKSDVQTVPQVDLEKYLGEWKEIRRLSNSFQDNTPGDLSECFNTIAKYGRLEGGKISVENTCVRFGKDGKASEPEIARAIATVEEGSGGAKLKVNFTGLAVLRWLGIGDGDYWVLGLGPVSNGQYAWALVGSPSRKYGWILARKGLTPDTEAAILKIAEGQGYDRASFLPRTR